MTSEVNQVWLILACFLLFTVTFFCGKENPLTPITNVFVRIV